MRDGLLSFVDKKRAYLKRKLQYFVNMLLFPVVDYGREKVRLIFDICLLDPREYTVNVTPKERRGINHNSAFFIRSLKEVVTDISETLVEVMDFAKAFENLKVMDDDYHLIVPLITKVLDAVSAA